ncbi:MAG: hypothetical protein P4L33_05505 [Capsulimonadaceae bacterium]|nr:hypothetical protein [Capsulimonadaceae bacterium]
MQANNLIEEQLNKFNEQLGLHCKADVLAYAGSLLVGADEFIRDGVDSIQQKKERLVFVLETGGGYIEVVERIVNTLRHNYKEVDFIVPNYAMSAGTVLVMSGDAIYMDYFSVLGPIDPQIPRRDKLQVPALGYLIQYERLLKKSAEGSLTTGEMAILLRFDQAELYSIEQSRELSIALLKDWLVRYKFKNWIVTETRKRKVTLKMRTARAATVGKKLNDTSLWHAHSRNISMDVLRKDLNLKIEDFGEDAELSKTIRSYHRLLVDYMQKLGYSGFLHIQGKHVPIS